MSFGPVESSQQDGKPAEAYEFFYGSSASSVYRYTNLDHDLVGPPGTFKAIPISRENYVSAGKTDKNSLTIRVPVTAELSELFKAYPPTQPVVVRIWQGHLDDGDYIAAWSGRVLSVAKEGDENVLTCESTIISLQRPGLRRHYQYACPYVLFGPGCNASKEDATREATVVSVTDGKLVLDAGWYGDVDPSWFAGGMIEWDTPDGRESRTIIRVEEDSSLTLIGPVRALEAEDTVFVVIGCDHKVTGCRFHNNIMNYGGQPWIPLKNPAKHHPFW